MEQGEYKKSDLIKQPKKWFSKRDFDYGNVEHYVFKFSWKVGYLICPLKY